jgi:hypothetical protein
MTHKYSEIAQRPARVFKESDALPDEQQELHNVWTSQLVRIKEMVDSTYNRTHPLQTTFAKSFPQSH